ncbi:tyrosine recombinase XerC [Nocardia sp. NPDC127526]|uniref:site-specific integrase n=1 Tax=Nocardia sp. NPDC127526 TaxID=3345393 RepID=UPI00362910DB
MAQAKRSFGAPRKTSSGRWQARYTGPDGQQHKGPRTWESKDDCIGWLSEERKLIELGVWTPPAERQRAEEAAKTAHVLTVRRYCDTWHEESENRLKPRTHKLYRGYLDNVIFPELGDVPLDELTLPRVRAWFAKLDRFPTRNANAYSLLRTIMRQAVEDELIPANPCRIKGAGSKKRTVEPIALSATEIRQLADHMPEKWRALVLVAGFGGLRWGEVSALRRGDFKLTGKDCEVAVARAAVRIKKDVIVGTPKTKAALRTVSLPTPLRKVLAAHLVAHAAGGRDGLVFPSDRGEVLHANTIRKQLKKAADKLGYPALRFHDLRHSAATLFAQQGATLSDHMAFMGHASVAMSQRYVHSSAARNRQLVAKMWAA